MGNHRWGSVRARRMWEEKMTKIQVERSALDRKGTYSLRYESSWRRKVKLQKYREWQCERH